MPGRWRYAVSRSLGDRVGRTPRSSPAGPWQAPLHPRGRSREVAPRRDDALPTVGAAEFVADLRNLRALLDRRSGQTISEVVRVDYDSVDLETPVRIELV
jgi:hypothetical protein